MFTGFIKLTSTIDELIKIGIAQQSKLKIIYYLINTKQELMKKQIQITN